MKVESEVQGSEGLGWDSSPEIQESGVTEILWAGNVQGKA